MNKIHKGIHYFSRVYCRSTCDFSDSDSIQEAVGQATEVIDGKVETLKYHKTAKKERDYLKSLLPLWGKGMRATHSQRGDEGELAVFFLGDPIPLPRPVAKKGYMVPPGFSMSLEQLMSAGEAHFKC